MKTYALFIPLFFSYFSHSQEATGYGKEIELSDTTDITIISFNSSATVSGYVTPNGFAGSAWFEIAGDTAKYGKKNFDWKDGTTNMTAKIHPLYCGTDYMLKLIARSKIGVTKTVVKHFSTTKCIPEVARSEVKQRRRGNWHFDWFKRLFKKKNPGSIARGFFI